MHQQGDIVKNKFLEVGQAAVEEEQGKEVQELSEENGGNEANLPQDQASRQELLLEVDHVLDVAGDVGGDAPELEIVLQQVVHRGAHCLVHFDWSLKRGVFRSSVS